jgi:hypothetical protein
VPKPRLRLAYSGPVIVKTAAEVLAIIRQRTADVLTADELALVIKLPAIEGPKPAEPVKKATPARRTAKVTRS